MSFLKYFEVANDPNLRKIPDDLSSTITIKIWNLRNAGNPYNRTAWHHLQSLKDLPEILPNLESISFTKSIITNFEDLTSEMPKLKSISFSNCSIHNFLGTLATNFSAQHTTIGSFEGLDLPIPRTIYKDEDSNTIIKEKHISLQNCTIRSLGGVSRETLQALLIAILSKDYPEKKYNDNVELEDPEFHKNRLHQIKLDLHPTALKLIQESINSEIERRYSPKYNKFWPRIEGQSVETFPFK